MNTPLENTPLHSLARRVAPSASVNWRRLFVRLPCFADWDSGAVIAPTNWQRPSPLTVFDIVSLALESGGTLRTVVLEDETGLRFAQFERHEDGERTSLDITVIRPSDASRLDLRDVCTRCNRPKLDDSACDSYRHVIKSPEPDVALVLRPVPYDYSQGCNYHCPECAVPVGALHHAGCSHEICPSCGATPDLCECERLVCEEVPALPDGVTARAFKIESLVGSQVRLRRPPSPFDDALADVEALISRARASLDEGPDDSATSSLALARLDGLRLARAVMLARRGTGDV